MSRPNELPDGRAPIAEPARRRPADHQGCVAGGAYGTSNETVLTFDKEPGVGERPRPARSARAVADFAAAFDAARIGDRAVSPADAARSPRPSPRVAGEPLQPLIAEQEAGLDETRRRGLRSTELFLLRLNVEALPELLAFDL